MQLQKKQSAPFFSQCSELLPEERRRVYFGRVSELPQELLRATLAEATGRTSHSYFGRVLQAP